MDLAINVSGNEQIDLLGRAIESDRGIDRAESFGPGHRWASEHASSLRICRRCWRTVGPCTRSWGVCWDPCRGDVSVRTNAVFSGSSIRQSRVVFKTSCATRAMRSSTLPDLFWDYLRVNLEPSIMASPDGHRWALAIDALDRCAAGGGDELQLQTPQDDWAGRLAQGPFRVGGERAIARSRTPWLCPCRDPTGIGEAEKAIVGCFSQVHGVLQCLRG